MKTLASIQYSHDHLADGNYFSTADDDFLVDMASLEEAMEYTLLFNPTFVFLCVYQVLMVSFSSKTEKHKKFKLKSFSYSLFHFTFVSNLTSEVLLFGQ